MELASAPLFRVGCHDHAPTVPRRFPRGTGAWPPISHMGERGLFRFLAIFRWFVFGAVRRCNAAFVSCLFGIPQSQKQKTRNKSGGIAPHCCSENLRDE